MSITFSSTKVKLPSINQSRVKQWIESVAVRYCKRVGDINYIFVDDEGILKVNREYLQHDYYTDIITFDYSKRRTIAGDLYISLDTVRSNAQAFMQQYERELHRVIIHGVLHLCGINDKGPGEREIMEKHEDEALKILTDLSVSGREYF